MKYLLAIFFIVLGINAARAECVAPPTSMSPDGINFLLGVDSSDGLLDVWCRIQALHGEYELTINFIDQQASRKFPVTFDGTQRYDQMYLASLIQSMLPVVEGPALDANGMNFGSVLERSVQVRVPEAPSTQNLTREQMGVPLAYDFSSDLLLWAPITLDLYPVEISGAKFHLRFAFRPSFGRYLLAKGQLTDSLILRGWHRDVLRSSGPGRTNCPDLIPDCQGFGDVIDVHTGWTFHSISAKATGIGLSATAHAFLTQLIADTPEHADTMLRNFNPIIGEADVEIRGTHRIIKAEALGGEDRVSGTHEINIRWSEIPGARGTYNHTLNDYARRTREAMVISNPSQN